MLKRRIVRVSAGALIVLAWAGAGVYAFWGGDSDAPKPPGVDAQQMSQQIAAVNAKPAAGAVQPAVAVEDAPAEPKFKFGGTAPKPSAGSDGAFKPRSSASGYQAPTRVAESPRDSVYGASPAHTAEQPEVEVTMPEVTVVEPAPEDTAPDGNPLRPAPRSFSVGDVPETGAVEEAAPISPPPSRFGPLPSEQGPPKRIGSRLSPPPANGLPTEDEGRGIDPSGDEAAPPPRAFGGASRIGTSGIGRALPREAASGDSATSIASARPGETAIEGSQQPSLVIEKLAPAEIQVGKAAKFEIHVRNAGQATAQNVVVTDHVPAGTKLVDAKPQAEQFATGALVWNLGKLAAGEDKTIILELMPEEEGEIGSVAQVTFAAAASVKTVCTKPLLSVEHVAPAKVMIGESVTLQITISNPGTGVATNVVLQNDVPEGLSHSAGKELEYEVGTLRPGESRKLELQLVADKAGQVLSTLKVKGDANLVATHSAKIEVIAPQLEVAMNGPKRRYLDRQATYTVSIANPGTATARDVEIVAYLPKGMKFVSTDKEGQYDAQHHAVYWSLAELPAAQQGSAQLVTVPIEAGEQKLRVEGHAQLNLASSDEETVLVEAIPQLVFEIVDEQDPIEVGAETVYLVRVRNEGTKAATNVQVAAALPPELRPGTADAAMRGTVQGQNVIFEPLGKLAPEAEATFKISAKGLRTGDFTIRVQVSSDDLQTPVTKEEPTRVYADR